MADLAKRLDVVQRLAAEGFLFNFFQALSLLEENFQKEGSKDPFGAGKIRCVPNASLAFPASDISQVREKKDISSSFFRLWVLSGYRLRFPFTFQNMSCGTKKTRRPSLIF